MRLGGGAEGGEGLEGGGEGCPGPRAAAFEAEEDGVGVLAFGGVLSGGFAHLLGGGGFVEDVVHDLEGEAQVLAEVGEEGELVVVGAGRDGAQAAGAGEQGAGLQAVEVLEFGRG